MEIVFNNIDGEYIKCRPEFLGDIQPKYWFNNRDGSVLVKRQHSQKVLGQAKKSKMFNHYGEYFGYLLAKKAGVSVCPADLITLHDTKNKYSQTMHLYTACYSRKVTNSNQSMLHGEHVIAWFTSACPEECKKFALEENCSSRQQLYSENPTEDNVDIIIAAISAYTAALERDRGVPEEEIKADIHENLTHAFDMFAYDCLFGNNDRHSQNWAMCIDTETGKATMYPLYDNERVLGLSRPEAELNEDVRSGRILEKAEIHNFSRMGTAPAQSAISYKDLLSHLVEKYPDYAIPAIQKIVDRVKVEDVAELFAGTEGIIERSEAREELTSADQLPVEYMVYGTTMYADRRAYARELLERAKNNTKTKNKTKNDDGELRQ